MIRCRRCGKVVANRPGLYGHFRFKHGIEYLTGKPVRETPYMRGISECIEEIGEISRDKKAFEAWRRKRFNAERPRDYEIWRDMQERRRRR